MVTPPLDADISSPLLVWALVDLGIEFTFGDKGFGDFLSGFERWDFGMVICGFVGILFFYFYLGFVSKLV